MARRACVCGKDAVWFFSVSGKPLARCKEHGSMLLQYPPMKSFVQEISQSEWDDLMAVHEVHEE